MVTVPQVLRVNGPVIWTWLVAVALGTGIQVGEGLGLPSPGLVLSAAAIPAAAVAVTPPRGRRWAMLLAVTLLAALAVANSLHHRVFGTYLPLRSFAAVGQGWAVRGYAAAFLGVTDLMPVLAVLGTAAAVLRHRRAPARVGARWHTALPLFLCVAGSAPALGWAWIVAPGYADSETGGFVYGHLVDARRILGEWRMSADPDPVELERVTRFLAGRAPVEGSPDPWRGLAEGSSVLMVQVEALNAWVMDAQVEGKPVVPFLRSLAERGLHFTNVFDDTHEGRSSDTDYLVLASQHPLERGAVAMTRPGLDMVALPDVLAARGYATFSAHAHIPGFWNSAVRHRKYGFQESLFEAELGPGESLGLGLLDRVFFQRSGARLARLPRPWMGWLITITMHGPHREVPPSFHTMPLGALEGTPLGNYLLEARHIDDALRELLDSLSAAGALEGTTVAVFGDHTESTGLDLALPRRFAGVEGLGADAQALLMDRVALIIVPPAAGRGAEAGARIATVGGLIDVAPTLLHLLGVDPPPSWMGRSLLAQGPSLAAQASGEVVGDSLMWTGSACHGFPDAQPRPPGACDPIRARAREELEVSWIITRYGLSPRLDGGR